MSRTNPTKEDNYKEKYKTFSEKQLREFQEVQTWLRTVSEKSGKQYLHAFKNFCNFCGENPKQLIIDREGYAPKSINAWNGAVRGFFSSMLQQTARYL